MLDWQPCPDGDERLQGMARLKGLLTHSDVGDAD
jgi:hypothetical protein